MTWSGVLRARMLVLYLMAVLFLMVNNDKNILPVTQAVSVIVPSTGKRCVLEEIPNNNVALVYYHAIGLHHSPRISVQVTSPYKDILHTNENVTFGQFAFTTKEDGLHEACFWIESNQYQDTEVQVVIDWRVGINARDWDSIVKKEKMEGVELHLQKLKGLVESIHDKLIHLKQREDDMRSMSERTNARVAWLSIMSIVVCIEVSVFQIWRQKGYFEKKKLI